MQKFITAVFISVFLLSSSIGFGVGRQVKALGANTHQAVAPANQVNIILVRIDNPAHPRLISVWGFFISRSENSSVIMKRLYPESGSETAAKIGQTFSLDAKNQPAGKFLEALNGLGLPGMKIALADESLAVDWLNGLAGQTLPHPPALSGSPANLEAVQAADQQAFVSACAAIEKQSSGVSLVSANFNAEGQNSPVISFSDKFSEWKGLVTSLHLSSCKMLVSP